MMKRCLLLFTVAASVCLGGAAQAQQKAIVAVFPLVARGITLETEALDRLTDYLGVKLAATGRFQIVPREQVRSRLRLQKRDSYRKCYDQSCQIEVGKELAAQKSMASQIIRLGSQCAVTVTLFDLRRATTEKAATHSGACTEDGIVASLSASVAKLTQTSADPTPPRTSASPKAARPSPAPTPLAPNQALAVSASTSTRHHATGLVFRSGLGISKYTGSSPLDLGLTVNMAVGYEIAVGSWSATPQTRLSYSRYAGSDDGAITGGGGASSALGIFSIGLGGQISYYVSFVELSGGAHLGYAMAMVDNTDGALMINVGGGLMMMFGRYFGLGAFVDVTQAFTDGASPSIDLGAQIKVRL